MRPSPPRSQAGYNLVILVVVVTILNVMVAAALPVWSHVMQRQREEELIFRGLQYAEAIRIFRQRFGRYPVRLEELIEVEPRSIRKLWEDPMTEHGEWGLVFVAAQQRRPQRPGQGTGQQGRAPAPPQQVAVGSGPGGRRVTVGPIRGVFSQSSESSIQIFNGQNRYDQWHFTEDLVLPVVRTPDPNLPPSMPSGRWIGRPFRPGIAPQPGTGPGGAPAGQGGAPRSSQRPPGENE